MLQNIDHKNNNHWNTCKDYKITLNPDESLGKKATMHQETTMLAGTRVVIKMLGHQYWWLASCYDLEIGHF